MLNSNQLLTFLFFKKSIINRKNDSPFKIKCLVITIEKTKRFHSKNQG